METSYFIIQDGKQVGPLSMSELKYHTLTPDTMVWRQGLPNWMRAGELTELAPVLANGPATPPSHEDRNKYGYPQQPGGAPRPDRYGEHQGYGNGYGSGYDNPYNAMHFNSHNQPIPHTNWMPWAIVATVLGCVCSCIGLIFGIVGIVKANKANSLYARGQQQWGDATNSSARTFTIIAFVFAALGIIGSLWLMKSGFLYDFSNKLINY